MICKNCGSTLRDDARFCDNCGVRIEQEEVTVMAEPDALGEFDFEETEEQTEPADAFCGNCGARLEPGLRFCVMCGTPVDGGAETGSTGKFGGASAGAAGTAYGQAGGPDSAASAASAAGTAGAGYGNAAAAGGAASAAGYAAGSPAGIGIGKGKRGGRTGAAKTAGRFRKKTGNSGSTGGKKNKKLLLAAGIVAAAALVFVLAVNLIFSDHNMMTGLAKKYDLNIQYRQITFQPEDWGVNLENAVKNKHLFEYISLMESLISSDNRGFNWTDKPRTIEDGRKAYFYYKYRYDDCYAGVIGFAYKPSKQWVFRGLFEEAHYHTIPSGGYLKLKNMGTGNSLQDFYNWIPRQEWDYNTDLLDEGDNKESVKHTFTYRRLWKKMYFDVVLRYDKDYEIVTDMELLFYNRRSVPRF